MSKLAAKVLILKHVALKRGCKSTDLANIKDIAVCFAGSLNQVESLADIIDELVLDGKLIQLEYTLPNSDITKSVLLPAETEVELVVSAARHRF